MEKCSLLESVFLLPVKLRNLWLFPFCITFWHIRSLFIKKIHELCSSAHTRSPTVSGTENMTVIEEISDQHLSRWDSGWTKSFLMLSTPSEQIQPEWVWSATQMFVRTLWVLHNQTGHSADVHRLHLLFRPGSCQTQTPVSTLPDVSPPVYLHSD